MIPSFVKERENKGEGFDLYFAGTQCDLCEEWMLNHNVCRLQSQVNDKKNISRWIQESHNGKLFIDSGAYTALTQGKEVDVDTYINYINGISDRVHIFAQVDYIPKNAEDKTDTGKASWDNYLYMRNKVKEPDKLIPIYHQSESLDVLKNMVEYQKPDGTYIDYIGFGALAGTGITVPQKRQFFSRCFSVIAQSKNPNVKVHAMGMTSLSLLEIFPFYSADSTSWIMQGATGMIHTPYGSLDVSDKNKYSTRSLFNNHPSGIKMVCKWLEINGITLQQVTEDYKSRMLCNLIYLKEWADNYKYKGGDIKIRKSLF